MTDPTTSPPPTARALWLGTLGWLLFSVVAVAIRGVRWEETYEHALVITRIVPYPDGHPFFIYFRNVFSGQSYLSAAVLWLIDAPLLVNGGRNILQLAFATVPVFLLGARFGSAARYGHVAVVFILVGVHEAFQSYYPIETWPHFYAVGQIGAGYALLILACLLHGWWRAIWLLIGLMPAIHIGQLPAIGATAGVCWLWYLANGDRQRSRQAIRWLLIGFAPCLLFWLAKQPFYVPLPETGAYAAEGDARSIWAAYSERHDLHRNVPRLNPAWKSAVGVMLALVLSGGAVAIHRRPPYARTAAFIFITGITVGSIWLLQQRLGQETPFLLIGWMPYRLANHLAVLLVPLAIGLLAQGPHPRAAAGRLFLALALLYAATYPLWAAVLPETLFTRYTGNPEGLFFCLYGAAAVCLFLNASGTRGPRAGLLVCLVVGAPLLAWLYPFGLAAMTGGALALLIINRYGGPRNRSERWVRPTTITTATAGIAVLVALLAREWQTREQLPVHPIQQEVKQYLADHGEPNAMLVPPYWDIGWLGKTRHPIFADYQTAHFMTYMPKLAPALKKMHEEVYGFTVDGDPSRPLGPWPERSAPKWEGLAQRYGFHYLLAPTEMDLQITPVLEGRPYTLYRAAP